MSAIGWLALSTVELVLFLMILRRAGKNKLRWTLFRSTHPKRHGVETVICSDLTFYFVM